MRKPLHSRMATKKKTGGDIPARFGNKPEKKRGRKPLIPADRLLMGDIDPIDFLPEEFWELVPRRQLFVLEYLRSGSVRQGLEVAGYEVSDPRRYGWQMLRDVKIRRIVDQARGALYQAMAMQAIEVQMQLTRIGRANVKDVMQWDEAGNLTLIPSDDLDEEASSAIKTVKIRKKTTTTLEGDTVTEIAQEIQLHDKVQALDRLARIQGLYKDEQQSGNPLHSLLAEAARRNRQVDAEFEDVTEK